MTDGEIRPAFRYYGSKFSHLDWILPRLPERPRYVEPFAGSAAVLLNRPRVETETINDINDAVVNFFRVLRERPEELKRLVRNTPYSRTEYERALERIEDPPADGLADAWAFFVCMNQVVGGVKPTPGRWSYDTECRTRTGRAYYVCVDRLEDVAERLRGVQIESKDGLDILERYDADDALVYADPPYPLETRNGGGGYKYDMADEDHRDFLDVVTSLDADVAISSYRSELYDEVLEDWYVSSRETTARSVNTSSTSRDTEEILYTTYDPDDVLSKETQATLEYAEGGDGADD